MAVFEHTLPNFFTGIQELYRKEKDSVKNKNTVKSDTVSESVKQTLRERLSNEYKLYEHVKQKLFKQFSRIAKN